MKESVIKKQIIEYLRKRGHFVWMNRNVGVFNAAYGKYIPAGVKGIPDILGLKKGGQFIGVEVKTKKNKPSIYQEEFLKNINKFGGIGIVAYSAEDCQNAGL